MNDIFSPDNPNIYPVDAELKILRHCMIHQPTRPLEGEEENERIRYVKADIRALQDSFKLKVSSRYCNTCGEVQMQELNDWMKKAGLRSTE